MSDVMEQLNDVVAKSDLADMMNSFVNNDDNGSEMRGISWSSLSSRFMMSVMKLSYPSRIGSRHRKSERFLSGLLKCPCCGKNLYGKRKISSYLYDIINIKKKRVRRFSPKTVR